MMNLWSRFVVSRRQRWGQIWNFFVVRRVVLIVEVVIWFGVFHILMVELFIMVVGLFIMRMGFLMVMMCFFMVVV